MFNFLQKRSERRLCHSYSYMENGKQNLFSKSVFRLYKESENEIEGRLCFPKAFRKQLTL